jgi:hypothetical protein
MISRLIIMLIASYTTCHNLFNKQAMLDKKFESFGVLLLWVKKVDSNWLQTDYTKS